MIANTLRTLVKNTLRSKSIEYPAIMGWKSVTWSRNVNIHSTSLWFLFLIHPERETVSLLTDSFWFARATSSSIHEAWPARLLNIADGYAIYAIRLLRNVRLPSVR